MTAHFPAKDTGYLAAPPRGLRANLSIKHLLQGLSWPAAIAVIGGHILWRDDAFSWEAALCCGTLGALALIAWAHTEVKTLPALPVVLTHFYFAMGFPVFTAPVLIGFAGPFRISSRAYNEAALAGLLFAVVVVVAAKFARIMGARVGPSLSRLFTRPSAYGASDTLAIRCIATIAIALHFVISQKGQATLGAFGYPATLLASPAVALSFLYWDLYERPSLAARCWFWGAVAGIALVGLGTGMLGSAFAPCLCAVLLAWTVSGRVHAVLMFSAIFGLVALNTAKHAYRDLAWRGETSVGVVERAQHWGTAIDKTYSRNTSEVLDRSSRTTSSRLSTLPSVAHIFEWVPAKIPHTGPDQWVQTPLEYIPRAIWRDKPQHAVEYNRKYALVFGLQKQKGSRTALTLPSVGDGFWRMGWLGVAIEAMFMGLLVGFFVGMQRAAFSRVTTLVGLGFTMAAAPDQHVFQLLSGQPQFWIAMVAMLFLVNWLPGLFEGRGAFAVFLGRPGPSSVRTP